MWRKKTDKRITATGILIAAAIIAYGAWQDMHPAPITPHAASLPTYYWVEKEADAGPVRADKTVGGMFVTGEVETGDTVTLRRMGVPPIELPQQESIPVIRLTKVPHSLSGLFDAIRPAITDWIKTGNIINDIYIDYDAPKPDLAPLVPLATGLRLDLDRAQWIIFGLHRDSAEIPDDVRTQLGNLLKSVEAFSYRLAEVQRSGETLPDTLRRLEKENLPFMLRVPSRPDYPGLVREFPDGIRNLAGFIIDPAEQKHQEEKP